jgi:CubicO group peptidase (beta-lactamase class C family)
MPMNRMNRPLHFLVIVAVLFHAACSGLESGDTRRTTVREVSDSRFDAYLREMERKEHFTGVALIMREEEIVHAKGYGAATDSTANDVDTRFHVGSITKQFTAAAIMQLAEMGVVKLDSSINTYLPAQYRSPKWDAVTLHHLLSHTSGITDYAVTRDYYDVVKGFCLGDTVDGMVKEAMYPRLARPMR